MCIRDSSYVGALEAPSTLGVAGLSSNDELCRAVSDALDGITVDGTLEAVHCVWYGTMPYDLTTKTVSGANVQPGDSESSETTSSGKMCIRDRVRTLRVAAWPSP